MTMRGYNLDGVKMICFECDNCQDHIETGTKDFETALLSMEYDFHWTGIKYNGVWFNYCPDCKSHAK